MLVVTVVAEVVWTPSRGHVLIVKFRVIFTEADVSLESNFIGVDMFLTTEHIA